MTEERSSRRGPVEDAARPWRPSVQVLSVAVALLAMAIVSAVGIHAATRAANAHLDRAERADRLLGPVQAAAASAAEVRERVVHHLAGGTTGADLFEPTLSQRFTAVGDEVADLAGRPGPAAAARRQVRSAFIGWQEALTVALGGAAEAALEAEAPAFAGVAQAFERAGAQLQAEVDAERAAARRALDGLRVGAGLGAALVGLVVGVGGGLLASRLRRSEARTVALRAERLRQQQRNDLEATLSRGLDMAGDEQQVRDVMGILLDEVLPGVPVQVLVADSSRSHFAVEPVTCPSKGSGPAAPSCGVTSPGACPAIRRGQPLVFPSSSRADACPFLRTSGAPPVGAVCVPMTSAGSAVAVLHAEFAPESPPHPEALTSMQLVGQRAGERIGLLRAFSQSQIQASHDPLTGLLNRRSLHDRAAGLPPDAFPAAVVFADLDHFKQLNDVYGHDVGDRALRMFAHVLGTNVRPEDLVARFGGEEFVVVLPRCDNVTAEDVLERVRGALFAVLAEGGLPPFTCSFGVAPYRKGEDLADAILSADRALLAAKQAGRDRIVHAAAAA